MKSFMTQLAVILGGTMSMASLAWNLSNRMDILTASFRAALVFFASVTVFFFFLRFFSAVLMKFVAEQVMQQHAQKEPKDPALEAGKPNIPGRPPERPER